jgi:transcriptional regulator with XRE-family HTH domain
MQAKCESFPEAVYDDAMQTGRPTTRQRPAFGQRLHVLREVAGLSQQQVAQRLGMKHSAYAWWERHPVALRPDQLQMLAEVFSVTVEELIGSDDPKKRGTGPVGKMRRIFEEASKLPRSQQRQISAVVEALIAQHSNGRIHA